MDQRLSRRTQLPVYQSDRSLREPQEREDKSKIDTSYSAKYDGKEVTISGSGLPYDTIAIQQVDANTLSDVRSKKGGMYKGTGRWVVSNGGKTATLTTKGTGADGKPFSGTSVYEKQ